MKDSPCLIHGGSFNDERGRLDFVNDFDLTPIKRIYFTTNSDINIFRGWQGHKFEKRWFFCVKGSFRIDIIKVDNWENPSEDLDIISYSLSDENPEVLYVPNGYVNGFVSLQEGSKLMLMSDYKLGSLANDEFRFGLNKWTKN